MRNLSLILLPILMLMLALPAQANHSFGGLDMCALYPEQMPPGMPPENLPQPHSRGAVLLQTYCDQCHALPGPGHHTAEEWKDVFARMTTLMDVSQRFGGLLGHVNMPDANEQNDILNYLQANSLQAMKTRPAGFGATAYETHCSACHALPDPAQHSASEWPEVLKRMQTNMHTMHYAPPSADNLMQIQFYLQNGAQHSAEKNIATPASHAPTLHAHMLQSSLALGPFLLLAGVGVTRWRRRHKHFAPKRVN